MWQDIIISISTLLLGYALIPQIVEGFRKRKGAMNMQTALITTIGLYIIAITFFTLKLYFSFSMSFFTGTLWAILLIQKIVYKQ